MAKTNMKGPLLKVDRADHHMKELEGIFRRYIRANIRDMTGKKGNVNKGYEHRGFVTQLSKHTPTVIGDIVHNLRVALEHAHWILVEYNGGVFDRHITFPFGKDRPSVKGSINGKTKTQVPSQEVIDFILDEMQPFEGGRLDLYDLHKLDILDKHEMLLPTYRQIWIPKGETLLIEGRPPLSDGGLVISDPNVPMFTVNTPVKYTGNIQKAITVLFGKGPMEQRPVLDTLSTLSENVRSSIISLATFL